MNVLIVLVIGGVDNVETKKECILPPIYGCKHRKTAKITHIWIFLSCGYPFIIVDKSRIKKGTFSGCKKEADWWIELDEFGLKTPGFSTTLNSYPQFLTSYPQAVGD